MAAQFILRNGLTLRGLFCKMVSATISLPVPLSPVIRTVTSFPATFDTRSRTSLIASLEPIIFAFIMPAKPYRNELEPFLKGLRLKEDNPGSVVLNDVITAAEQCQELLDSVVISHKTRILYRKRYSIFFLAGLAIWHYLRENIYGLNFT